MRIVSCIQQDIVDSKQYYEIISWGLIYQMSDIQIEELINLLIGKSASDFILCLLHIRFVQQSRDFPAATESLIIASCNYFLTTRWYIDFEGLYSNDYANSQTLERLTKGLRNNPNLIVFYENLLNDLLDQSVFFDKNNYTLKVLIAVDPPLFLDCFILSGKFVSTLVDQISRLHFAPSENIVNLVEDESLIDWCLRDPLVRFERSMATIQLFVQEKEQLPKWRNVVFSALSLDAIVPRIIDILDSNINGASIYFSHYDYLNSRLELTRQLISHNNSLVRLWAEKNFLLFQAKMIEEKAHEEMRKRDVEESFE